MSQPAIAQDMFLTPDEVARLTGYRHKSKQVEWLSKKSWNYKLTRDDYPVILRAYAVQKMGLRETTLPRTRPKLEAIRK